MGRASTVEATIEQPPPLSPPRAEVQVRLRLMPQSALPREGLEGTTLAIEGALAEHAVGLALGPASARDFTTGEIELEFTVAALSESEVFQRIGLVLATLEGNTPMVVLSGNTAREAVPA